MSENLTSNGARQVIMDTMPFVNADGSTQTPYHCRKPMADSGGCAEGCCDDFECVVCGHRIRMEWPA